MGNKEMGLNNSKMHFVFVHVKQVIDEIDRSNRKKAKKELKQRQHNFYFAVKFMERAAICNFHHID